MFQISIIALLSIMIGNYLLVGAMATKTKEAQLKEQGAFLEQNITTNRYTLTRPLDRTMSISTLDTINKQKMDKEAVQKTLIRICNAIYQKGEFNNCASSDSVVTTWGFMTDSGINGDLLNVYNGTTNNTFSCGGESDFGRFLLNRSLPQNIVSQYNYNLNGIADADAGGGTRTYPCGYSEIVSKKIL